MSSGQVLGAAEESIGTTLRTAVADYYQGKDLSTANAIRDARSPTEAARIVTAMRQGRALEVLLIPSSAGGGAGAGVLSQKAVNNATIKGVPPVSVLGAVPAVTGLAAPISLSGRSVLTAGGLTFITGAVIYKMLAPPPQPEGTP
jgi:hypothetical protein